MRISADSFIGRVFEVLKTVGQSNEPVSLHSTSEKVGLPKPTVFRILQSLRELGYIESTNKGATYRVTGKVYDLVPVDGDGWLRKKTQDELEKLHGEFNETVNLACIENFKIRYISILESTQALRCIPDDRMYDEALRTALGRVVAAYLPADQLRQKVAHLCELAGYSDVSGMLKELARTKRRGWAWESEQNCAGIDCIAVPLFEEGVPFAGISVSIPSVRLKKPLRDQIVKSLKASSARINATRRPNAVVGSPK